MSWKGVTKSQDKDTQDYEFPTWKPYPDKSWVKWDAKSKTWKTVIDPTANDTDPKGRGLAVQQVVEADPTGSMPVTAAVVDLHLVRIGGSRPLRAPVELAYTVFDGTDSPTGLIRVVPVPAPRVVPPPLTAPVQATVRAGDAVTIPVTRFTTSQDGAPVTVTVDAAQVAALPGRVLVTGDAIRYLAPADAPAGQVSFGYIASSGSADAGQPAQSAGTVTIAGGILKVGVSNALGAVSAGTTANGGTLDLNAQKIGLEPVYISGTGVGGALLNSGAYISGAGAPARRSETGGGAGLSGRTVGRQPDHQPAGPTPAFRRCQGGLFLCRL